ncbi:MAG: orotate phosphoribosyltransferase [Actinobacteria bacterium]|nr:orotate phosphoribosyltransferase [Actinomycetota bacterium]
MTKDEALEIFRASGALLEGHFRLTSGLHSSQYFQCALVLQYPQYAEKLCREIANHFIGQNIETVISPAIGGIVAGQEVARLLGTRAIFAERENEQMTLRRGFSLKKGERVLAVEDVVTTGGSLQEVITLAQKAGADVVGVGYIVDRSGGKTAFDVPAFPVFQMDVVAHQPDDCPLCKKGFPIVKPGSRKD